MARESTASFSQRHTPKRQDGPTGRDARGLADIQSLHPTVPINLTRVGITGVKKLVEVSRPGARRPIILISDFDLFVDLPARMKGANLSRNMEAMNEVLEEAVRRPIYEIEDLCGEVARRLLERHDYASRAEVRLRAELMVERKTPVTKIGCQEMVDIFSEARHTRGGEERKLVGAEVLGMTACPCAQEMMRDQAADALREFKLKPEQIERFLEKVPTASHNQRSRGIIAVETTDKPRRGGAPQETRVPLETLIRIIEDSMSSEIFELLKRPDEAHVVHRAHTRPQFVEDCVRAMAQRVVEELDNLPGTALVTIKQVNEESIHRHDAFAERTATLGELRRELAETPGDPRK
ncbi:MAG: GTP cyclohydrolase I FolE2 [Euryarchaeota archaeon]|nr:GTP cyclohydrolase I FolE2 [Euryarchaeota archaeon]